MITKERLQELINQRATIWHDDFGEIKLNEKCEILDTFGFDNKHQPIEGSILRFYYIYDNQLQYEDYDITELEENVESFSAGISMLCNDFLAIEIFPTAIGFSLLKRSGKESEEFNLLSSFFDSLLLFL